MIAAILATLLLPIQDRFDLSLRAGGALGSALLDSVAWELDYGAPAARLCAVEELAPLIGWEAVGQVQRDIILGEW